MPYKKATMINTGFTLKFHNYFSSFTLWRNFWACLVPFLMFTLVIILFLKMRKIYGGMEDEEGGGREGEIKSVWNENSKEEETTSNRFLVFILCTILYAFLAPSSTLLHPSSLLDIKYKERCNSIHMYENTIAPSCVKN